MSIASAVSIGRHRAEQPSTAGATRKGFRADIQGLRALAVLLVILYHSRVPGVSAGYVGVDVFFVISGFLITTQLAGEAARTGHVRLLTFWAKRIRRLLPVALVVVAATVAVARFRLPPLQVPDVVTHAVWSTFYGINYRLAAEDVDYQRAGADPSPLQHYWSLSVEEQFYVLWPLLVLAALWLGRRRVRHALPLLVALVVSISLVLSALVTVSDPSLAYFALHTRAWELGAGALVALGAGRLARIDRRAAPVMAWGGLGAITVSAVAYSDATAFPGLVALLPVGGAALVIAAGCGGQTGSVTRVFDRPAVQVVATLSYGWYLWHWPVLVLAPGQLDAWGWVGGLALCAGALVLAAITHRFVERPTQASMLPTRAWLGIGAALSAATVGIAALTQASLPSLVGSGPAVTTVSTTAPADAAYLRQVEATIARSSAAKAVPRNLKPSLRTASEDTTESSHSPEQCLSTYLRTDQGACVYGDPRAVRTVVLFGDSHMEQWQPAFDLAGKRDRWKVVVWTKSACPLADLPVPLAGEGRRYTECDTWRDQTVQRIIALAPDLVVTSQSDGDAMNHPDEEYARSSVATVRRLRTAGLDVDYLLDDEHGSQDVPLCLSGSMDDATRCGRPERSYLSPRRAYVVAALTAAGISTTDPAPWQCAEDTCPPVVGNLLVYRDRTHLSATYVRWLTPMVQSLLKRHP